MLKTKLIDFLSPTKYLSFVNAFNAGLGAILGIINARLLGPEAFGIIGVIAGINATIVNVLDVRLMDVVGKLYYRSDISAGTEQRTYRASVILVFILSSGILGLLIGIIGFFAGNFAIHLFTSAPVKLEWLAVNAYFYGISYISGAFMYQQRFSERFYLIGTWRLISQIASLAIFLGIILNRQNLDGYYAGSFASTSIQALAAIGLSIFIWRKYEGFPLMSPRRAWGDYLKEVRMVLWGNLLGYTKLLHRGSDVLLVGFFADDRVTGLYKVARSVTDTIYVLYDALNQVYYPRFMQLLSTGDFKEYRRLAWRIITNSSLLVVAVLGAEAVGLSVIVQTVLTSRFLGAESTILILTLPVFFVIGFYTWFWPIFVYHGKLGYFTLFNILACGVQYMLVILGFNYFGSSPAIAAAGYLGYYIFLVPVAMVLVRKIDANAFPFGVRPVPAKRE